LPPEYRVVVQLLSLFQQRLHVHVVVPGRPGRWPPWPRPLSGAQLQLLAAIEDTLGRRESDPS
jgi:hypothetical protein